MTKEATPNLEVRGGQGGALRWTRHTVLCWIVLTLCSCGDAAAPPPPAFDPDIAPPCDGVCDSRDATRCPMDCEFQAPVGTGGAGAEGGAGATGGTEALLAGECWTIVDCEIGEVCLPQNFDGLDGTIGDLPGACSPLAPTRSMGVIGLERVIFTGNGFVMASGGLYDVTISATTFVWRASTATAAWTSVELPDGIPFESYAVPSSYGFAFDIEVASNSDPNEDVTCLLSFDREGDVIGGVVRGPGKALCSTGSRQFPGDPGLLVEFEHYCLSHGDCPATAPFCEARVCVFEETVTP
ncbi:MAG: hypothetical protein AAF436_09735 [Myxococcota bacterium]